MYSLSLPPTLVSRLYRLREDHQAGPIRRQVLSAVEQYLAAAERQFDIPPPEPIPAPLRRKPGTRTRVTYR